MATTDRTSFTPSLPDPLRSLEPPASWDPSAAVALARFRERAATHPSALRPWGWSLAAAAVCVSVLFLPGTRALAQRLWDGFRVDRVEFLRVDVARLPPSLTESSIHIVGPNMEVATSSDAEREAGFAPRLPSRSVVPGDPALQVFGAWSLDFTVRAGDLQDAMRNSGVWDLQIPRAWNGARITLQSSRGVSAGYADVELLQSLPPVVATPPGFEFGRFTETLLRIVGLNAVQARMFGARMAAAPSLFVLLAPEDPISMRQVRLRRGDGTLLHEPGADGGFGQTTLVWNTSERLYVLNVSDRLNDDYVIAVADSIP